jgi:hypothetical protein
VTTPEQGFVQSPIRALRRGLLAFNPFFDFFGGRLAASRTARFIARRGVNDPFLARSNSPTRHWKAMLFYGLDREK